MFKSDELYLLNKILHRVKYTDLDLYEINEFANSPITNEILEKLRIYFEEKVSGTHLEKNYSKSRFEFDNEIGIAIRNRLTHLDDNVLEVISTWDNEEIEKYALDIIGPIDFEQIELEKLKCYILNLSMTSR